MTYDEALAVRSKPGAASPLGRCGTPDVRRPLLHGRRQYVLRRDGRPSDGARRPRCYDDALDQPHTGLVNFTGRPMKGSVLVEPEALATDADLAAWLARGLAFVRHTATENNYRLRPMPPGEG